MPQGCSAELPPEGSPRRRAPFPPLPSRLPTTLPASEHLFFRGIFASREPAAAGTSPLREERGGLRAGEQALPALARYLGAGRAPRAGKPSCPPRLTRR